MAKIGSQQRQQRLHIGSLLVPESESGYCESVSEIMGSDGLAIVESRQLAGLCESDLQARRRQPIAARAEEEGAILRRRKGCVAVTRILAKGAPRRGVNWNEAVLAEFGLPNGQDAAGEVDVGAVQPEGFT
jgi:hypothetical protein